MTVTSKIVFQSDASQVRRDTAILVRAREELEKLNATSKAPTDPKIAAIKAKEASSIAQVEAKARAQAALAQQKADNQAALAQQKAIIGVVERRQKAEIAADARAKTAAKEIAATHAETARSAKEATAIVRAQRTLVDDGARAAHATAKGFKATEEASRSAGLSIADMNAGLEIAQRIGQVIWAGGAAVVNAQAFKEDVREALSVVAGGAAQSAELMNQAAKTADLLGKKRADVAGVLLDLTTKGFDKALADRIIRSVSDLGAIDPNASLEGVVKVLGKAQAQGRINLDILSELNTFGLEQGDVIKQIGEMLGKNDTEVLRMLSAQGGIRGLGVEPILQAISAQVGGGEAGAAAMAKARRNLSSLIEQVKDIPANVLFDLDVGPAMDRLKGVLREIIDFFSATTASGQDVRAVVGDIVSAFAEGLFGIDTSKGIKETLQGLLETVRASKGDVKAFAQGIAAIGGSLASVTGFIGKLAALKKEISDFFMGPLAEGGLAGLALSIAAPLLGPLLNLVKGIAPEFYQAGADLIKGLADGIVAGASAVWSAAKGAAQSALDTVKGVFQSHSPAKATIVEGINFDAGLAKGMEAKGAAQKAAGDLAAGAVDTTRSGLGISGGTKGGVVIHASFAPRYTVTALGPAEVDKLRELQADERAKWNAEMRSFLTTEAMAG